MDSATLISAVVAVAGASVAVVVGYWTQRRLRGLEQRNLMQVYGASLAWAAFDLQSRLFNILHGYSVDREPGPGRGFLTAFHAQGDEQQRDYVRRSTVFVLGEYLGWTEILRRDVQFLDLGRSRTNREIMATIMEIGATLNRTSPDGNALSLFRAQQRAIGELMIHPEGQPGRRRCLGYAEFCAKLDTDESFRRWFEQPLADVDRLAGDTDAAQTRLREIQQKLITLIDLLDARSWRLPHFRRPIDAGPAPRTAPGSPPA